MKKILVSIMAAFFVMALNAQVSVWDGTAEPWTHGNGTPEDPYLIENAQQLAYIAQKVNEPTIHSAYEFYIDTCFRLTSDLDLGGNNKLLWTPIGKYDRFTGVRSSFAGHFDGDGHTIYNMYIESDLINLYMGLFGLACNGSIKNIIMASNCTLDFKHGTISNDDICVGSVLAKGNNIQLENCTNMAFVSSEVESVYRGISCGGLFGSVTNGSMINNCHNFGDVNCRGAADYGVLSPAGIVSYAKDCDIIGCTNKGNITCVKNVFGVQHRGTSSGGIAGFLCGDCNVELCFNTGTIVVDDEIGQYDIPKSCGGIVGISYNADCSTNIHIRDCYNVSDIYTYANNNDRYTYAGGIFGVTGECNVITIENCYTAGVIESDTIGGIIAYRDWVFNPGMAVVANSYYVNTMECFYNYGTSVSDDYMKSQDFVNLLNNGSDVYAMDDMHVNEGYPIFAIYYSVEENIADKGVPVYPNPAQDIINISFDENVNCNSVEIYSIDGRIVETFPVTSSQSTINIVNLNAGVYMMKVKMSDGKEYSEKIVKE